MQNQTSPETPDGRFTNEQLNAVSGTIKRPAAKGQHFTDETIESLRELGDVLRRIHRRLVAEGIDIHAADVVQELSPRDGHEHNRKPNTE